jgi:hypothetical protein
VVITEKFYAADAAKAVKTLAGNHRKLETNAADSVHVADAADEASTATTC